MYSSAQLADEQYESPPQYELPASSLPSSLVSLSSSESIDAALSVFFTLTPADIGDVLQPHLSFIFSHLSVASLRSLVAAAEVRQRWRLLPRHLLDHIVPFLPPLSYLALSITSRHFRAVIHQPHWHRLQHVQLIGRADDNLNQHSLSLLKRSLPQLGELTLRAMPLTPLLLLSLDRFNLNTLRLTHCTVAASTDTWLALGSSSCLRQLRRLEVEAVSGFDDESLSQLVVDNGKHPSTSLTALHLTSLQLSELCGPALASLCRCFPMLTDLSLAHNEDLADTCILSLAAHPPPLISLTLAHCPMLSMAALQAVQSFPELSKLDVTSCFQMTSLAPLSSLAITSLSAAYTAVTAPSFSALSHLPLRHLHLSAPSAALPAWLAGNTRRPPRLHLLWDEAEDEGLQWMAAMGVVELQLKGRRVTDAGLVKLLNGYLDGGRVRGVAAGEQKDRAHHGKDEKLEEKKEKEKDRDSKGKSWFSRAKAASSSSHSSSSSASSPASGSSHAASFSASASLPLSSAAVPSQPLPLVYLSSALLPPPPLRLHSLVLRSVDVSDVGLLRCLHALMPLGLARVELLQCGGVTWKAVEWLMNWRREHRQDVRVVYEL